MKELSKDKVQRILEDSGLHTNTARQIAGNLKEKLEKELKKKEVKESKDIFEIEDEYK